MSTVQRNRFKVILTSLEDVELFKANTARANERTNVGDDGEKEQIKMR